MIHAETFQNTVFAAIYCVVDAENRKLALFYFLISNCTSPDRCMITQWPATKSN